MADALVDLQDHLARQQQEVHAAARARRCFDQDQGLFGDSARDAREPQSFEHFDATLAPAISAEAAALAEVAVVGERHEIGRDVAEALLDLAACARDQERARRAQGRPASQSTCARGI
jgi:hypothetical protein